MSTSVISLSRSTRTPGRSRRTHSVTVAATEPPNKRRRFLPGGPGGGGRYIEEDGKERADEDDGGMLIHAQTAPRSRSGRQLLAGRSSRRGEDDASTPTVSRSARPARSRRGRPERYVPPQSTPRPRYSNAAAAAAASQASDGYKPREERSWEDFHPDLDIDAGMVVFTADEVDGRSSKRELSISGQPSIGPLDNTSLTNGAALRREGQEGASPAQPDLSEIAVTPIKRRPGRPPRRPESMLHGLGSPPTPRINPLPTHNPKERLNLPKPSFRIYNHYLQYEEDQKENKVNYVDRTMANVGYQETDRYELPPRNLVRWTENTHIDDEAEVGLQLESDGPVDTSQAAQVVGRVEYDMDEQDVNWLSDLNEIRKSEGVEAIKPAIFEITMTQIEKEYHALEKRIPKPQPRHAQMHRPRSSSQAAVNGDFAPPGADEPDSKCAICDDGDCENANAIIFCDGCDLAVHQECYGVPFIPEGQWFCRKCKEIGRGTPTCIFCPNVDGAFKQTSTLRWSHLLCAIFIPEVTISNMTFMEPITDVDRVPKSRWKLNCYICSQKMGACIQCGNKNCYQAFHVSCARKAKLFLKMKSAHQQGLDTTALKAFCDKHVPPDWRRTHDTDNAVVEAKRWYRHTMRGRRWADSQTAALEMGAQVPTDGGIGGENGADDTIAVTKRRRNQPAKMNWRLPSGAPVVPAVVYNTVELSLTRFTIRKRKEFVERVCRYWTLKREARRGAALLKRLQLQLETFSSMEITRRNFAGMGSVGRPRLARRIDFAEMLQSDMTQLTTLCSRVRQREQLRLKEVETLRELVDTVYFPIPALLAPILQRARKLDEKTRHFADDFEYLALLLRERYYTSVRDFSHDLSLALVKRLARSENVEQANNADIDTILSKLNEVKPGTADHLALTQEQKDVKRLAKRIIKAIKEPLQDAMKKEAELRGRELEEELRKLDSMGIFASTSKVLDGDMDEAAKIDDKNAVGKDAQSMEDSLLDREGAQIADLDGGRPNAEADVDMQNASEKTAEAVINLAVSGKEDTIPIMPNDKTTPTSNGPASSATSPKEHTTKTSAPTRGETTSPTEPLSPPCSTEDAATSAATVTAVNAKTTAHDSADVFANGGVPWYLEPFDPLGTTVHAERYTGREVLRDMSEELSDMDEDTLTELAGNGVDGNPLDSNKGADIQSGEEQGGGEGGKKIAAAQVRKKARSSRRRR